MAIPFPWRFFSLCYKNPDQSLHATVHVFSQHTWSFLIDYIYIRIRFLVKEKWIDASRTFFQTCVCIIIMIKEHNSSPSHGFCQNFVYLNQISLPVAQLPYAQNLLAIIYCFLCYFYLIRCELRCITLFPPLKHGHQDNLS